VPSDDDEYGPEDFENPDAPEGERRLRSDHPDVRDLSYDEGSTRIRQRYDLMKGSLFTWAMDPWQGRTPGTDAPGPYLQLFIKERSRGPGYACDFLYRSHGMPCWVYGVLVNEGRGLVVNELEFWRPDDWGYRDGPGGRFIGKEEWERRDRETAADDADQQDDEPNDEPGPYAGITTSLLRKIPLGKIVARAQEELADLSWEDEGIIMIPGGTVGPEELSAQSLTALEAVSQLSAGRTRGRPRLDDALMADVARAYLRQAPAGPGLIRRLAQHFDRPEPTIRDWVAAARTRGFLSSAVPGRRGAAPGPRLQPLP
jgi:hypothetical protein